MLNSYADLKDFNSIRTPSACLWWRGKGVFAPLHECAVVRKHHDPPSAFGRMRRDLERDVSWIIVQTFVKMTKNG